MKDHEQRAFQSSKNSNYEAKTDYQKPSFAQSYERLRFGNIGGKFYALLQSRTIGRVLDLLPPGSEILDLACGTGRVTEHLLQHGFRVSAGDISQAMLDVAREKLSHYPNLISLQKMDAEEISAGNDEFEYTICIKLMHLVPSEVRVKILNEISRVTQNFIIVSYSCFTFYGRLRRIIKIIIGRRKTISRFAITKKDLEDELNAANLEIIKKYWTFRPLSEEIILLIKKKSVHHE
jgi:2-polyprenyl-3-methyl-5-hydroxy-6-metoxy-1,4-benzoquinol methylase